MRSSQDWISPPELLAHARENALATQVTITWKEGDVESLPFEDGSFDVVLSQFGHMFAPRADMALREMLRVLKRGGRIAFSTWPPQLFTGKMFALVAKFLPPPPLPVDPPPQWGNPDIVRQRLGDTVTDILFDTGRMLFPTWGPLICECSLSGMPGRSFEWCKIYRPMQTGLKPFGTSSTRWRRPTSKIIASGKTIS